MSRLFLFLSFAGAVLVVAHVWLAMRIDRREALFESQFIDALELAARSMRAGHPLPAAFQLIPDEMEPPVSTPSATLVQPHALGAS